jgi:hypothetical protein
VNWYLRCSNVYDGTGCCKSPIRFEKRVYLSKPTLNLLKTCQNELKTWFLLDLDMKVWTKDVNRNRFETPKT